MKSKSVLKKTLIAAAVAGASVMAPAIASAEVSANLGIASQYLWRGQSLFGGGTVSGGIDYEHGSGLYAGFWTSSENEKTEYDLYGGFAGEAGGLSYDIGYTSYFYTVDPGDLNFQEIHLALGYGGFGVSGHFGVGDYGWGSTYSDGSPVEKNKDNYYTVSYAYDKFGVLVGFYDTDDSAGRYTHLDLSYEFYDGLVFTASKIVDEADPGYAGHEDELQFVVSYTFSF